MRLNILRTVVAVMFVVAFVSRAGTGTDAVRRSHCAAIGYELRARAAAKAADIKAFDARNKLSAKNQKTAGQWKVYLDHLDAMGKVLIENFSDPRPPATADRAWAQNMDLVPLTHAGEACTG